MTGSPALRHIWIIGPGRLGLALGSGLLGSGSASRLSLTGRRDVAPPHPLFDDPRCKWLGRLPPTNAPDGAIICVPDDAVTTAARLAGSMPAAPPVVLHTSGVLESDVLRGLVSSDSAVGSFHPLVAIPDPVVGAEKLIGAWFGVEGSSEALALAERLVTALRGRVLRIGPGEKALYHVAAVFASNYVVTVLGRSLRLFVRAGIKEDLALAALGSLAEGAVRDVTAAGPVQALTGPIARGDAGTVKQHLGRLSGEELTLYSVLAREALAIARTRGLDQQAVQKLTRILEGGQA